MGEKIMTLSKGVIFKSEYEIELNSPPSINKDRQIHIQSSNFRFEINEKEFIKFALTVLLAEKNLKTLKNIK
jgi:hypothetical protein